jgi:hypothetical protein
VGQYALLVVVYVTEAAGHALVLFDDLFEAVVAGIGDLFDQRDQDRGSPGMNGVGQLGGFDYLSTRGRGMEAQQSTSAHRILDQRSKVVRRAH